MPRNVKFKSSELCANGAFMRSGNVSRTNGPHFLNTVNWFVFVLQRILFTAI